MVIPLKRKVAAPRSLPLRIWMIWLCGALFYCYQFALRTSPSVLTEDLMSAFGVEGFGLGVLTAFYYNAYAAMQMPVGILLDRFNTRHLLTGAVLICALGAWVFGEASSVSMACFGRLLMGIGSSFAYIGTLKIATLWFPADKMGTVIGITMLAGTLGAWMGGFPYGHLAQWLGWRISMSLLAIVGIGLALTFWIIMAYRPSLGDTETTKGKQHSLGLFQGMHVVFTNPQTWIVSIYAGLMYVPLSAFADLWGTPFFAELYHIDRTVAASMTSMIYIGIAVGSPLITYLSDRLQNRTLFMKGGALFSFVIYLAVIYLPHVPVSVMYVLLFMGGVSFAGQILSFVFVAQAVPLYASGVAISLTNMIVMSSGVIFEPLIGKLLSAHNTLTVDKSLLPYYPVSDYQLALSAIPISLAFAFILAFVIKEPESKIEG